MLRLAIDRLIYPWSQDLISLQYSTKIGKNDKRDPLFLEAFGKTKCLVFQPPLGMYSKSIENLASKQKPVGSGWHIFAVVTVYTFARTTFNLDLPRGLLDPPHSRVTSKIRGG